MSEKKNRYVTAEYSVVNDTGGVDTMHFQTIPKSVVIIKGGKVHANLDELLLTGKKLSNVDVNTIDVSGTYVGKNFKGLDDDFPLDKMTILSVGAFNTGENETTKIITATNEDGKTSTMVVKKDKLGKVTKSKWIKSGAEAERRLEKVAYSVGDTSELETKVKDNVVGAINEISTELKEHKKSFDTHTKDFDKYKSHNHDDKYIQSKKGTVSGDMTLKNSVSILSEGRDGKVGNILRVGATDELIVGSEEFSLNLVGKDNSIIFNGEKVWTSKNDGVDSGLDADLLGGISHKKIPRLDKDNSFLENITTNKQVSAGSALIGGMKIYEKAGRMTFTKDGVDLLALDKSGRPTLVNHIVADGSNYEVGMRMSVAHKDYRKGMGFYRNNDSKYFGFYDWDKNARLGYFSHENGSLYLDNAPRIQGRALYLQSSTPSGKHTVGDIWIK